MTRLDELREFAVTIREEISELEEAEKKPIRLALIGKCFKYRNCYSCPEKPSDYWYLYLKVLRIKGANAIVEEFQCDKYGEIQIKPAKEIYYPENTLKMYELIPDSEYKKARVQMAKKLKNWIG